MLPPIVTAEKVTPIFSGMAMSMLPLWVSKSNEPLRSRRPAKVMLPVTVSIFVRSKTPLPPSTLIGPLTVEKAASGLAPWSVIVPLALLALTQVGDPVT